MDLGELPFDMPKLNRRLHAQAMSTETAPSTLDPNMSHASSSQSMRDGDRFGIKFLSHRTELFFYAFVLLCIFQVQDEKICRCNSIDRHC